MYISTQLVNVTRKGTLLINQQGVNKTNKENQTVQSDQTNEIEKKREMDHAKTQNMKSDRVIQTYQHSK